MSPSLSPTPTWAAYERVLVCGDRRAYCCHLGRRIRALYFASGRDRTRTINMFQLVIALARPPIVRRASYALVRRHASSSSSSSYVAAPALAGRPHQWRNKPRPDRNSNRNSTSYSRPRRTSGGAREVSKAPRRTQNNQAEPNRSDYIGALMMEDSLPVFFIARLFPPPPPPLPYRRLTLAAHSSGSARRAVPQTCKRNGSKYRVTSLRLISRKC